MSEAGPPEGIFEGYARGEGVSLRSYAALAGVFNAIFVLFLLVARAAGRPLPRRVGAGDIALLGVATHKLSLIATEDAVTSPLRAPFTELQSKGSPKTLDERPRGEGLRRSIGELLTCRFCSGMWIAALFSYGLVLIPRLTRMVAAVFAVVTVSDHLHQAYKLLMNRAQGRP